MTTDLKLIDFDTLVLPEARKELFPPLTRRYIEETAEETQTTLDANCMAALSVFSVALSGKFIVKGPWTEMNNIYTCVVAGSGERKSTTFKRYAFPIIEMEKEASKDGKNLKLIADDVSIERIPGLLKENDERIAIYSAESGIFETAAGRYGNTTNLDVLLKSFDGEFVRIERVNKEPVVLTEPSLTFGLFAQPTMIQNLPARFIERGLWGRFLFSFPKKLRGQRNYRVTPVEPQLLRLYDIFVRRMVNFNPSAKISLTLEESAMDAFLDYCEQFQRRMAPNGDLSDDSISSWTDRFPGQLLRIASLLHIAEQAENGELVEETINRIIPLTVIKRVLDESEYFVAHARMALGTAKTDPGLEDAKYILHVFERNNRSVMSRQELWSKSKGRFMRAEKLDHAITILEDRDYIKIEIFQSNARGRKGQYIILNKFDDEKLDQKQDKPTPSGSLDDTASVAQSSVDSAFREVKSTTGRG